MSCCFLRALIAHLLSSNAWYLRVSLAIYILFFPRGRKGSSKDLVLDVFIRHRWLQKLLAISLQSCSPSRRLMLLALISEQHRAWKKEPGISEIQRKKQVEVHHLSLQCRSEVFCCPNTFLDFSLFSFLPSPNFSKLCPDSFSPLHLQALFPALQWTCALLFSLCTHKEQWEQHPQTDVAFSGIPLVWLDQMPWG